MAQTTHTIRTAALALWGMLALLLLAACGGEQAVVPAGAAQGQATFLYFYTDA